MHGLFGSCPVGLRAASGPCHFVCGYAFTSAFLMAKVHLADESAKVSRFAGFCHHYVSFKLRLIASYYCHILKLLCPSNATAQSHTILNTCKNALIDLRCCGGSTFQLGFLQGGRVAHPC